MTKKKPVKRTTRRKPAKTPDPCYSVSHCQFIGMRYDVDIIVPIANAMQVNAEGLKALAQALCTPSADCMLKLGPSEDPLTIGKNITAKATK